jgi:hypothetical protein
MIKLKLHVRRWLGGAALAVLLAGSAYAQDTVVNIQASGIYQGGNTVIGGVPYTNSSPFTQYYSLLIPSGGIPGGTYAGASYEVITIGGISYTNTQSSISLVYGSGGSGGDGFTQFQIQAGASAGTFGFDIALSTNLFGGQTTTLTAPELGTILSAFQSNSPFLVWGIAKTDIYANANDISSTISTIQPTPEPSTMALAGMGGLSLLFFRRRK